MEIKIIIEELNNSSRLFYMGFDRWPLNFPSLDYFSLKNMYTNAGILLKDSDRLAQVVIND